MRTQAQSKLNPGPDKIQVWTKVCTCITCFWLLFWVSVAPSHQQSIHMCPIVDVWHCVFKGTITMCSTIVSLTLVLSMSSSVSILSLFFFSHILVKLLLLWYLKLLSEYRLRWNLKIVLLQLIAVWSTVSPIVTIQIGLGFQPGTSKKSILPIYFSKFIRN